MASVLQAFITQKGPRAKGEGKISGLERWTYGVTYQVQTDAADCPPDVVKAYFKRITTLPWFGRKFKFNGTSDAGAICSEVDVVYIEKSEGWFTVDCTFTPIEGDSAPESRPSDTDDGEPVEDPLQWRKEISVTGSQSSFPVVDAIFRGFDPPNIANPFLQPGLRTIPVNSAVVPFDPPPEFDRSFAVLRIAWRQAQYDEDKIAPWRDMVNSDPYVINWPRYNFVFGIPQYRGRIKQFGGSSSYENNVQHWRMELEIWVHPISWREQLADMGTVRRAAFGDPDGAGGVISTDQVPDPGMPHHEQIKDADGYPLMQPVLLNGNGQPMPLTKADGGFQRPNPVWLKYQYYNERRFQDMNIHNQFGHFG